MRKLLLIIIAFLILISPVFAIIDFINTDYLFFQNKQTNEIKYIQYNSLESNFSFNYYLMDYLRGTDIGGEFRLTNWNVVRLEKSVDFLDDDTRKITIYLSGEITVDNYGINSIGGFTGTLSNISKLNTLNYGDLTSKEVFKLRFKEFTDFFGIRFFFFLPLNILIFFCFGYMLFSYHEKYKINFFKYVYFNSFLAYLLFYLVIIYYGFSYTELSSYLYGEPNYLFVIFLKGLLLFESIRNLRMYHKQIPESSSIYKKIFIFYIGIFVIYQIYIHYII